MVVSTWLALAAEKDLGSLPRGLGVSPRAWLEKDCRQCLSAVALLSLKSHYMVEQVYPGLSLLGSG